MRIEAAQLSQPSDARPARPHPFRRSLARYRAIRNVASDEQQAATLTLSIRRARWSAEKL